MKRYAMLLAPLMLASMAACGGEEPGEVDSVADAGTVLVSAATSAESGARVPARIVATKARYAGIRGPCLPAASPGPTAS